MPPATGQCVTTLQPSQPGAPPQQSASQVFRGSDGKTRVDSGDTSVITDPSTGKSIVLDHVTKQARIIPMPPSVPGMPGVPQMPAAPSGLPGGAPQAPAMNVKDLGTKLIDGQEVQGKQFMLPPAQLPPPPQLPAMPGQPQLPPAPPLQKPPTVAEVWTSTKLQMPVLTTVSGDFGQQTCKCQNAAAGEPAASMFQIPPGYTQVAAPPKPSLS